MGQEFREASLWINSFLSCLLTHNFIISLSLSSSSSTDLSFLPRKAHSRYYCLLVRGWFLSFFLFLFKLVGRSESSLLHKASLLFDGRHQREKNRYKPSSATDIYFFCLISRTKNGHNWESFVKVLNCFHYLHPIHFLIVLGIKWGPRHFGKIY